MTIFRRNKRVKNKSSKTKPVLKNAEIDYNNLTDAALIHSQRVAGSQKLKQVEFAKGNIPVGRKRRLKKFLNSQLKKNEIDLVEYEARLKQYKLG